VSDPNLFSLDVQFDDDDPVGYHVGYNRVGPLVGAEQLGLSVYELPPGNSVCPYHYEPGCDEWLIVLVGTPTLRMPEGEQELRPWDAVFFPPDETGAHKVTNRSNAVARVAMISTKPEIGTSVYPDSDKIGIWPPGKLFELSSAVDYFTGEL
jgi:uncharacterized cupin superfamily protein